MGSTRLPGKALLPLGERPILKYVVSRCRSATSGGEVVVTTGDAPPNDAIREWCRRASVTCVTGPEENLLERHREVAAVTDSDVLVRITGDCPFVPPEEIDRVLDHHREAPAALTTNNSERMPIGTAVDVLDRSVLTELAERGATHPVAPLRDPDSSWMVRLTDSDRWAAFGAPHTAVDTPEDYWNLVDAVDAVGTDPYSVTAWLAERDGR